MPKVRPGNRALRGLILWALPSQFQSRITGASHLKLFKTESIQIFREVMCQWCGDEEVDSAAHGGGPCLLAFTAWRRLSISKARSSTMVERRSAIT